MTFYIMVYYLVTYYNKQPIKCFENFKDAYIYVSNNRKPTKLIVPFDFQKNINNKYYSFKNAYYIDEGSDKIIQIEQFSLTENKKTIWLKHPGEDENKFKKKIVKIIDFQKKNVDKWCYLCNTKKKLLEMKKVYFLENSKSKFLSDQNYIERYVCSLNCKEWKINQEWKYDGKYFYNKKDKKWFYKKIDSLSLDDFF